MRSPLYKIDSKAEINEFVIINEIKIRNELELKVTIKEFSIYDKYHFLWILHALDTLAVSSEERK